MDTGLKKGLNLRPPGQSALPELPGGGPLSPRTLQRRCCLGHVVLPALRSPSVLPADPRKSGEGSVQAEPKLTGGKPTRLFLSNDAPKESDNRFHGPWTLSCKLQLRVLEIASSDFGSSTSCRVFSCHCAQFERVADRTLSINCFRCFFSPSFEPP